MKKSIIALALAGSVLALPSCKKYLDVNTDPDRIAAATTPLPLLLTNSTVQTGFRGGSDLFRFGALLSQQLSGQTSGGETQTQQYDKYLIQATELNNLFNAFFSGTLNNIEVIIKRGATEKSPHYAGVAKLLKAYNYQLIIDTWGDMPYSEAQQTGSNLYPKYDKGEDIYKELIKLIDGAIVDLNATASELSPGANATIYSGTWSTAKAKWIKFANTLKLRLYLHYSKLDKPFLVSQITALVNSGATFFEANADNFEMPFFNENRRQNPIHQYEIDRSNYLFPAANLVNMMNAKADPRRPFYFTQFPFGSGNYAGATSGEIASQKYSRMHTYLRGAASGGTPNADGTIDALGAKSITYTGTAPIRLLTFAEYNFIRAEAALYGAPGAAQTFFEAGIRASLLAAGVATADANTYVTANGTLTGTDADKLKRIIEEKYVANYGVILEPWTDWRRTGYPAISKVPNGILNEIPRSLLLPQIEVDNNINAPAQKTNMLVRVFWDK
jgi:hypothetical protein